MAKLEDVEGIGKSYAAKLRKGGIRSQKQLLDVGSTKKGRSGIAKDCNISEKLVLGWVNRADLCRVKGVGEEYADLLECAGVDTVPELSNRNASNLHLTMADVNKKKKLVRQLPSEKMVKGWVSQAKKLPRVIKY